MMDYKALRKELDCHRPLIFFHDDPDGLCSFLLFYRYIKEGKGVVVKSHPRVDHKFVKHVRDYQPDKVFILDLALVADDFIDAVGVPIVWVDHHPPQEPRGTHYYNPRIEGTSIPASQICYNAVLQDLWIAMAGITADWHFDKKLAAQFRKDYPDLLPAKITKPEQALFDSPLGTLARIFWFALKGDSRDAMKYVKVLTRIESPYEILNHDTPAGSYLYKKYRKIDREYQELLKEAESGLSDGLLLEFVYPGSRMSFTRDLTNELYYRHPEKLIVVGRDRNGEVKLSLSWERNVREPLKKALVGIRGYGGGHEHACGAVVHTEDYPKFMENLRNATSSPRPDS
jgi:single-stranded DNA-specific DHH superfamily exonuclease